MPYSGMNLFSALLGLAGSALLLRYAPLPLVLRLCLPFTYFLAYQYSVVARSYSLAPPILFVIASQYKGQRSRPIRMTVLLILLAMVSAQALLISAALAACFATWYWKEWKQLSFESRRVILASTIGYLCALALIVSAVWPSGAATFVVTPNWSLANFVGIARYSFHQAFGEDYWPLAIVFLSLPLLRQGPGLVFFALSSVLLCLFGASIYSNVWHHGFLVLAWLTAIWISAYHASKLGWAALLALSMFIGIQCSWTYKAIRYDWSQAYSGSKAAAAYLEKNHLSKAKVFGIGFPTVSLQPYFSTNLYANYSGQRDGSFWLWSKANTTNDSSEKLGSEQPNLVVLGYAAESDRKLWSRLITQSGYDRVARFEGNTFWETGAFQPENFDIYRRAGRAVDTVFASALTAGDPRTDEQFLWGFLAPAQSGGVWVTNAFGTVLQRPPGSSSGQQTQLTMDFELSPDEIKRSGPMRLTAYVSGRRLPSILLQQAGRYKYVQSVRNEDLYWAVVPVSFQFQKTGFALSDLTGEQVAVVARVALAAK